MKKRSLLLPLSILLLFALWSGYASGTQTELSRKMLRLHVMANSDTAADQQLKIQVKDKVYTLTEEILQGASDQKTAQKMVEQALPRLEVAARQEIFRQGYDYPVKVALEYTDFPTKVYEGFTLPAGRYLALRVLIGEAAGENWWCVVFPPLCQASVSDLVSRAELAGFTQEEIALITEKDGGYIFKFRLIELWQQLWQKTKR